MTQRGRTVAFFALAAVRLRSRTFRYLLAVVLPRLRGRLPFVADKMRRKDAL